MTPAATPEPAPQASSNLLPDVAPPAPDQTLIARPAPRPLGPVAAKLERAVLKVDRPYVWPTGAAVAGAWGLSRLFAVGTNPWNLLLVVPGLLLLVFCLWANERRKARISELAVAIERQASQHAGELREAIRERDDARATTEVVNETLGATQAWIDDLIKKLVTRVYYEFQLGPDRRRWLDGGHQKVETADFVAAYPELHHMAEAGSWPSIQQVGLKTTEQLVDECAPSAETREAILGERRKGKFHLTHPVIGPVTIRDQKPLMMHNLEPALTDMTVDEWLQALNNRVFFWAHTHRLQRLLKARDYRAASHDVLIVDTQSLLDAYADRLRLAGMNTGSTIFPNASPRGSDTFRTVETFPFDDRRKARKRLEDNVVEVCVLDGVPDVSTFVVRVEEWTGAERTATLFEA